MFASPEISLRPLLEALRRGHSLEAYRWDALQNLSARSFLSQSDLDLEQSFVVALGQRLLGKVLPPPAECDSWLDEMRQEVSSHDIGWLEALSGEALAARLQRLAPPPSHPVWERWRHDLRDAIDICAHRLAALGLDPELHQQMPEVDQPPNPFLEQCREVDLVLSRSDYDPAHLWVLLGQCQEVAQRIWRKARRSGASLHLTHLVLAIRQNSQRLLDLLRWLLDLSPPAERAELVRQMVLGQARRHSLRRLLSHHGGLIALKATQHASQMGHHYIAENPGQLLRLFFAAAGAGVIVAVMALVKIAIAQLHLPLGLQTLLFGLNYAGGFVLIHLCGFTVATKQPAMTAATLAASLSEDWRPGRKLDLSGVARQCRQTLRSQFTAIAGNCLLALPGGMMLAWIWRSQLGAPLISADKAHHLLQELEPWGSPALAYAAVAGVGLFLSGFLAGYVDNLGAYFRLPERLRHSPLLQRWLGRRVEFWARQAETAAGSLTGNVVLGLYLGGVGGLGQAFGLPLDIRHVSFASANLGYAASRLDLNWGDWLRLGMGVLGIGLVNLAVSFGLALWLAFAARGLGRSAWWALIKTLRSGSF